MKFITGGGYVAYNIPTLQDNESTPGIVHKLETLNDKEINWIDSVVMPEGVTVGNFCGFSAMVIAINVSLAFPEFFYNDGELPKTQMQERFRALYLKELGLLDETNDINTALGQIKDLLKECAGNREALQSLCARSVKTAFAQCITEDNTGHSPFDTILEITLTSFTAGNYEPLADYADFLFDYVRSNAKTFEQAQIKYREYIDQLLDKPTEYQRIVDQHVIDDAIKHKVAPKEHARDNLYKDTKRFKEFFTAHYSDQYQAMRSLYAKSLTMASYQAREIDLYYIGRLIGLRSIVINNQMANRTVGEVFDNKTGLVDLMLQNRNKSHWLSAPFYLGDTGIVYDYTHEDPFANATAKQPPLMPAHAESKKKNNQFHNDQQFALALAQQFQEEYAAKEKQAKSNFTSASSASSTSVIPPNSLSKKLFNLNPVNTRVYDPIPGEKVAYIPKTNTVVHKKQPAASSTSVFLPSKDAIPTQGQERKSELQKAFEKRNQRKLQKEKQDLNNDKNPNGSPRNTLR